MKQLIAFIFLLLLAGCTAPPDNRTEDSLSSPSTTALTTDEINQVDDSVVAGIAGSYRCWQFNVDGYGGSCRTLSPIVLAGDGTYTISSTTGTYNVSADTITLSASDYWGPGTIQEDGLQIYFNYSYNGKQYEVTYLKE